MKFFKKITCVFLVVLMCMTSAPLSGFVGLELPQWNWKASAYNDLAPTGQCGDDVYWDFDSITGELVISGTGEMYSYSESGSPFFNKLNIKNIIVEEGVTSIGENAFYACYSMETIKIPDSVVWIGETFVECMGLESIIVGADNPNYYSDSYGVLYNKDKTTLIRYPAGNKKEEYSVLEGALKIEEAAFAYSVNIVNLKLPNSLIDIGAWAFHVCEKLSSINIPEKIDVIKSYSFIGCESLKEIILPNGLIDINQYAFSGCTSLNSLNVPDSVTKIGDGAFSNCINLEKITLSDNLSIVHADVFKDTLFYNTKSNWNYGVLYIGKCLIAAEKTLSGVYEIKNGTKVIATKAFENCTELTGVIVPDSITNICSAAFSGCKNLVDIVIPDCDVDISRIAFGDTLYFDTETNWENNVLYIGNHLITARGGLLSGVGISGNYEIKKGTCNISDSAFSLCTELENIVIPDSITKIREQTFFVCKNLKSMTFSNAVQSIGDAALYGCESLTDVYFYGTESDWNAIDIGIMNDILLSANIHFLGEEEGEVCNHNPVEQTIPASCIVNGMKFYICDGCGEPIGETEILPAKGHSYVVTAYVLPTCTSEGSVTYTCLCEDAYTEIIPANGHKEGEWEIVLAPTYEAEGKRIKKCSVCGETIETETLPKLQKQLIEDKETGVAIEIPAGAYNGKVEIDVSESFDGTAFNILDTKTGAVQQKIYDIKMLVNGEESQPNGKITVKIPLPAGYNPKFSFVYYVNTETGALEKMNATYEDGYMVFETDHFSYYAVIAEPDTDNCSCNCHKSGIAKFFFKFLLFFQKIFRANKVCKCGVAHY